MDTRRLSDCGQCQTHPAVSIVVPLYNVEAYISDTIASLKAQTFEDFEVVIVDDGSSDDSAQAALRAIDGDVRFKLIRQQNAGPASARNRALDEVRGEYLMFVDADDSLERNAIHVLYSTAVSEGLDYLDFNAHTVYEDPSLRSVRDESFYENRRSIEGVMSGQRLFATFQFNREYVCALWLHFFKRSLLEESGLRLRDGMYVHEDELFSPLLIAYAKRAAFLNRPLYCRRVREGSAMTSGRGLRNVSSMFDAAQGLRTWLTENADACEARFVGALSARIAELYGLAAEDAMLVDASELVAYAQGLEADVRVDFEVDVIQRMVERDEFYRSRTYRAGKALVSGPKAARDALSRLKGKRASKP